MEAIVEKGKYIGRLVSAPLKAAETSTEAGATAASITGVAIVAGAKATVGIAALGNPLGLFATGVTILAMGFFAAQTKEWDNQDAREKQRLESEMLQHKDNMEQQRIDREWKIYHDNKSLAIYVCVYAFGSAGTCYSAAAAASHLFKGVAFLAYASSALAVVAAARAGYLSLYPPMIQTHIGG